MARVYIALTSGTTWTVPLDCKNIQVECIGAGSGNGGSYSVTRSILVTPFQILYYNIGLGTNNTVAAGDTWLNVNNNTKPTQITQTSATDSANIGCLAAGGGSSTTSQGNFTVSGGSKGSGVDQNLGCGDFRTWHGGGGAAGAPFGAGGAGGNGFTSETLNGTGGGGGVGGGAGQSASLTANSNTGTLGGNGPFSTGTTGTGVGGAGGGGYKSPVVGTGSSYVIWTDPNKTLYGIGSGAGGGLTQTNGSPIGAAGVNYGGGSSNAVSTGGQGLIIISFIPVLPAAGTYVETLFLKSNNSYFRIPFGVTSINVDCIGAGSPGKNSVNGIGGPTHNSGALTFASGGGGGAYSRRTGIAVKPNQLVYYQLGTPVLPDQYNSSATSIHTWVNPTSSAAVTSENYTEGAASAVGTYNAIFAAGAIGQAGGVALTTVGDIVNGTKVLSAKGGDGGVSQGYQSISNYYLGAGGGSAAYATSLTSTTITAGNNAGTSTTSNALFRNAAAGGGVGGAGGSGSTSIAGVGGLGGAALGGASAASGGSTGGFAGSGLISVSLSGTTFNDNLPGWGQTNSSTSGYASGLPNLTAPFAAFGYGGGGAGAAGSTTVTTNYPAIFNGGNGAPGGLIQSSYFSDSIYGKPNTLDHRLWVGGGGGGGGGSVPSSSTYNPAGALIYGGHGGLGGGGGGSGGSFRTSNVDRFMGRGGFGGAGIIIIRYVVAAAQSVNTPTDTGAFIMF